MSLYRDILYRDYSAAFSEQKRYFPDVQHRQYAVTYPPLPSDGESCIADLGCGKGEWLCWVAGQGFSSLIGVDGSAADLEIASRNGSPEVHWVKGDVIEHLESHAASYDLLHAKDVIEHLTKDEFIRFLQAVHHALKPGGRVWLLTFNAQSPLSSATRYGDFTHETGHTPASLAQCFRACGFKALHISGRHYCSQSMGGRVRAILGALFYRACRLILKLRHGSGGDSRDVDLYTALPDIFVDARRDDLL